MATLVIVTLVILMSLVQSVDCDCNRKYMVRPTEDFIIISPNYPGNFTPHADCYYELSTTSQDVGTVVFVDVLDISLSCDDALSQLSVYDGFSRRPRLLGRVCKGGNTTFESPKGTLYLTFRTRALHRSRGFKLRVRGEPKFSHCYTHTTKVVEASPTPAIITSPYYPYETDANVNCLWLLKAPTGSAVNATLLAADMRGSRSCKNFGLFVYDGKTTYDDRLLASVCDNSAVRTFQSTGPYLLVVFTSGSMVYHSGGGIQLQFSTFPLDVDEHHTISQTLFFVITAFLMVIILSVTIVAALKLVLLPRRRKQAERRRIQARARLTCVSLTDSQADLLQGEHRRVSSSASLTSCESTNTDATTGREGRRRQLTRSDSSLMRLFAKYGLLKRWSRRDRRESERPNTTVPALVYRRGSNEVTGVTHSLPGLPPFAGSCAPHCSLPPTYEEATAHPAGLPIVGDCTDVMPASSQPAVSSTC